MDNEDDMDTPVTRRELREELLTFEQKLEQKLEQKFAHYANAILEGVAAHIGALDDKYSSLPKRTDALEEAVSDLTPRVVVLEHKAFAPPKRRPAKRASRRR